MAADLVRLFSYGTLQQKKVQLETFGRLLIGEIDILQNFFLSKIEITDNTVISRSGKKFHPIIFYNKDSQDEVKGMVFTISYEELLKADGYEVDDYSRVELTLKSGKKAWVYTSRDSIKMIGKENE